MMRPPPDPLKPFQWKARVLVVSAPQVNEPQYKTQERALAQDADGQADRELVVVRLVGLGGDSGVDVAAWRERLSIPPDRFELVLVGKDGGVALRQRQSVALEEIFARIDAMPMRREVLRKRKDALSDPESKQD
jgi:hypothetical protein